MNAKAIPILTTRQNLIDVQWFDENDTAIDMTGYTLSGDITWSGGSLDIDGMLSYTDQSAGQLRLTIPKASAELLPAGAASKIDIIATVGANAYYVLEDYTVFAE